jgi:hypothetical protein
MKKLLIKEHLMRIILEKMRTGILPYGPSQGSVMLYFKFKEIENGESQDSDFNSLAGDRLYGDLIDEINTRQMEKTWESYLYNPQGVMQGFFQGSCLMDPKYSVVIDQFFTLISKASLNRQKNLKVLQIRPPFMVYIGEAKYSTVSPKSPSSSYENFNFLMTTIESVITGAGYSSSLIYTDNCNQLALAEMEQHRLCTILFRVSSKEDIERIDKGYLQKNLLDMDPQRVWVVADNKDIYDEAYSFTINNNFRFALYLEEYKDPKYYVDIFSK